MGKYDYIVIGGPTASGKTAVAAALAARIGGEVVSADSMQIYKGIPISTAQPTEEEMLGIPHHMVAVAELTESWSVQLYRDRARNIIEAIRSRGKVPILVGGTGFWREAVMFKLDMTDAGRSDELRAELMSLAEREGGQAVYERLRELDPVRAAELHPNDLHRVIRAIEVCTLSGGRMSEMRQPELELWGSPMLVLLQPDRDKLYERINRRVDSMVEQGLLSEAERVYSLVTSGALDERCTALSGIGCKELFPYFNGECSLEESLELLRRKTRNYAKRQLTWQRREKPNLVLNPLSGDGIDTLTEVIFNVFCGVK